jgi:hypothetical protein
MAKTIATIIAMIIAAMMRPNMTFLRVDHLQLCEKRLAIADIDLYETSIT